MHAAQSLNTKEVSAPEPAEQPSLEAGKGREASPGIGRVEAAGKTSRLPPKPVEKLADGGERVVDRVD